MNEQTVSSPAHVVSAPGRSSLGAGVEFPLGFWTVSRKLAVMVVIVAAIGFAAFVTIAVHQQRAALHAVAVQNYVAMSRMLVERLSGPVRWKNSQQVALAFQSLVAPKGAPLRALTAYPKKGSKSTVIAKLEVKGFSDEKARALMKLAATRRPDKPRFEDADGHLVVISPVTIGQADAAAVGEKATRVGTVAMAWDTSAITAQVGATIKTLTGLALVTVFILAALLGVVVSRGTGRRIRGAVAIAHRIAEGHLDNQITVRGHDELGQLANALGIAQANLQANDDSERRAAEFGRIKQALDHAHACVMVTDAGHRITYVNDAAQEMFRNNQAVLREAGLINLDAEHLLGASIDVLHGEPVAQRRTLDALTESYDTDFEYPGCTLRFVANPVCGAGGERLGTAIEWTDRTREMAAEREIQTVVDAAAEGGLSTRVDVSRMSGFHAEVGTMLNRLTATTEIALNETQRVLNALADGDHLQRIESDYQGLFGELKASTNRTSDKLTEVVGQIRTAAAEVNRGATEISEGNASLSSRTEQQASSLEQTAAAMEEMTSTVKQNADNARQANQLADGARAEAERGGEVASQAVRAVSEISAASRKIADIIGVIDEIAFQTNLLALNASVEAARAGEQGRGFAVVASEVRNLAGRSATAAKEIKALIQDSVIKVDEGQKLVEQSGQVLEAIVGSVKKVSDIVSEIAAASSEQTEGIDQINQAVTQIDEMTQRNATLVEEAAAASAAVGQEAHRLDGLVGYFKNGDENATVVAQPAPVAVERRGDERPWTKDRRAQPLAAAPAR